MSRVKSLVKNTFYNYVAYILSMGLRFVLRTVFIYKLGVTYLGVNELFTEILGLLSFAELGFGVFLNTCLYKPVHDGDKYNIIAYMNFYKFVYNMVALVIFILGIILFPFLDVIVKDPGDIGDIRIYYLLYLANTSISYLVSYQVSLLAAEQKNYKYTIFNMVFTIAIAIAQVISLLLFNNFLIYLLVQVTFSIVQRFVQNIWFRKLYPYLYTDEAKQIKITNEQYKFVLKNVKAQIINKFSDRARSTTDSIIISSFINVTAVGLAGNYKIILGYARNLISPFISESAPVLGNLVVSVDEDHKYRVFREYWLIAFWIYTLVAIEFVCLINPFIYFWLGKELFVDKLTIVLLALDFAWGGQMYVFMTYKTAHGVFSDDYVHSLIEGFINLILSIALVIKMGLAGVFVGTVVTQLYDCIIRPMVSYKRITGRDYNDYICRWVKYNTIFLLLGCISIFTSNIIFAKISIMKFIVFGVSSFIIINVIYLILFHNTYEFDALAKMIVSKLPALKNREVN